MAGTGEGGWLPPEKIKSRHFEKFIDCMVLKLTVYIRSVISFSKPCEIPICRTFLPQFSNLTYISLKIGYFELSHGYDVTVTSYLGCWYLFWYLWKEETPSHGTNYMYLGVSFPSLQVGGNPLYN